MSVNLSAVIGCKLNRENLYRLPETLNGISQALSGWSWFEFGVPDSVTVDIGNFENLIEEGWLWIEGPDGMTIAPGRESLEVGYGWAYKRFFTQEKGIYDFIDFCTDLSIELGCGKIYFLGEAGTTLYYQQISEQIENGELTETILEDRHTEFCDHDVYTRHITNVPA